MKDPILNKITGQYAKIKINKNGEKLIEFCSLHSLRKTNMLLKLLPNYQTTWQSLAPYKSTVDAERKKLKKNPYRTHIDVIVRYSMKIKISDSCSYPNVTTISKQKPVITKIKITLNFDQKINEPKKILRDLLIQT